MRLARTVLCVAVLVPTVAVLAHDHKRELHYIYVLDGGSQQIVSGGALNIANLGRIMNRYEGRFFFFTLDGRSYVIRDAVTLAAIDRSFATMRALEPEREAIRRRLDPLEHEEDVLDESIDALEDSIDDDDVAEGKTRAVELRVREMERQLQKIEAQIRVIEREEERLDQRIEALEEEAERQLLPILRKAVREGRAEKA